MTATAFGADLAVDLDQTLPCWMQDCDRPGAWMWKAKCPCPATALCQDHHIEQVHLVNAWPMVRCHRCGVRAPATSARYWRA
ncbi:hypothetical protein MF406_14355 [Georgenia sp. TF02-10]|uniref:hypothetical protein n=1 Tax=Georgenia sp. TF02-10 TaxID=2917725 RepID=UPI001FA8092C|nr:hypothetical protein [Georgenia sp. TF02-10]UNX54114.1 hypothetical protein MF406_14355 [Georgenia sp. TF02-10]